MSTTIALPEPARRSLGFYTPAEAARIAQVPQHTLNAWRRNGIVIPSVRWVDEKDIEHLGHTFETLIFMRLLRMLRQKGITLYRAVNAVRNLKSRFGPPSPKWADARIWVERRHVYVHSNRDEWASTEISRGQQKVAEPILGEDFARMKERADALLVPSQFLAYVEIDPSVQNGLPIVKDTRILTSTIHAFKKQGYLSSNIHTMYPFIRPELIEGAEEYETFLDNASGQANSN